MNHNTTNLKTYNIYCDESRYTNPFEQYFLIGSITIPRDQKHLIHSRLKKTRRKFGFMPELKWGNVTKAKLPYLNELIQIFFTSDMEFRAIIIDKSKLKLKNNHQVAELPFYKFYYLLLRGIIEANSDYYIFLDEKTNEESRRISDLEDYLVRYQQKLQREQESNSQEQLWEGSIRQIQPIQSENSLFIQMADLFMGAVGYYWNGFRGSEAKMALIRNLLARLEKEDFKFSSQLYDKKWNQFVWTPRNYHKENE